MYWTQELTCLGRPVMLHCRSAGHILITNTVTDSKKRKGSVNTLPYMYTVLGLISSAVSQFINKQINDSLVFYSLNILI